MMFVAHIAAPEHPRCEGLPSQKCRTFCGAVHRITELSLALHSNTQHNDAACLHQTFWF